MCVSQSFVYDKQTDALTNACNNALFFSEMGLLLLLGLCLSWNMIFNSTPHFIVCHYIYFSSMQPNLKIAYCSEEENM